MKLGDAACLLAWLRTALYKLLAVRAGRYFGQDVAEKLCLPDKHDG
jgi:hypothetical protein